METNIEELIDELRRFADNRVHPIVSPDHWNVYSQLVDFIDELDESLLQLLKEQDNCENCAIAIEDRQPVVRCKDCKYWRQLYGDRPFYSSTGCCDCDDMWRSLDGDTTEVNDIKTDSDFYCGYADRR